MTGTTRFSSDEIEIHEAPTFEFSRFVAERVKSKYSDFSLDIDSPEARMRLIQFLRSKDSEAIRDIGLYCADSEGVHDVVFGAQPFGDFYFCDMLCHLYTFNPGDRVLDFGCSSGRTIRNLYKCQDIAPYGCDPRSTSIDFNKRHFPDINWFVSNERPPISREMKGVKYDMVFAVSVWSHFSEKRALEWFKEMAAIMESGSSLIFSTHGIRSVYHFNVLKGTMPDGPADERLETLRGGGYHFKPYPSGSDLDKRHWGMAFIPKAWFEKRLGDSWVIDGYFPGMAMKNQDVYVLRRA